MERVVRRSSKDRQQSADLAYWLQRPCTSASRPWNCFAWTGNPATQAQMLNRDFKEFAELLNAEGVEYPSSATMRWLRMGIRATRATSISGFARPTTTSAAC